MKTYDPVAYWTAAGRGEIDYEAEANFVRTPVFAAQEWALLDVLEDLTFESILEVGCGWGRITRLVRDRWPDVPYLAIDLSPDRIESAGLKCPTVEFEVTSLEAFKTRRRFDLVLSVEVLMHLPPDKIEAGIAKLLDLTRKGGSVVSLDWSQPLGERAIADHNWRHEYEALYEAHSPAGIHVEPIGLQSIYVVAK